MVFYLCGLWVENRTHYAVARGDCANISCYNIKYRILISACSDGYSIALCAGMFAVGCCLLAGRTR